MVTIHFGYEFAEYIRLTVSGREQSNATNFHDANWLTANVEVAAGAFKGTIDGSIRAEELSEFCHQLELLYERLEGEACFLTMETWIELRVTANRRGHVEISGRLNDDMVAGNTLLFFLNADQTFLPRTIAQLQEAVRQFPAVGSE